MITRTLLLTGLTLASAGALAASPSSYSESAGYKNCRAAAENHASIATIDARYYIYQDVDSRRFYLNGYGRVDGERGAVKIACDISNSGHRVHTVAVDLGRYKGRLVDPQTVASRAGHGS